MNKFLRYAFASILAFLMGNMTYAKAPEITQALMTYAFIKVPPWPSPFLPATASRRLHGPREQNTMHLRLVQERWVIPSGLAMPVQWSLPMKLDNASIKVWW